MREVSKTFYRFAAAVLLLTITAPAPGAADASTQTFDGENRSPRYCLTQEQLDSLNDLLCAGSAAPPATSTAQPEAAGDRSRKFWRRLAQAEEVIRVLRRLAGLFGLDPDVEPVDVEPMVPVPPVDPPPVDPPPGVAPIDLEPSDPPSLDPAAAWGVSLLANEGFRPAPGAPSLRLPLDVPPGSYRRVTFHLEVARSAWGDPPQALQNLIWLVKKSRRGRPLNRYMLFYVNVRGPQRDQLILSHGWGTRQGKKAKVERSLELEVGKLYTLDGDFDLATGEAVLRIGGPVTMEIRSAMANKDGVEALDIGAGEGLWVDLGFDGRQAGEVPLAGLYRNLQVQVYK